MELLITLYKNVLKGLDRKSTILCGALENIRTEQTNRKCFRCGSEDPLIAKCPKPPKDNEKQRKQIRFNEKGNRACDNSKNNSDQKIYA